jgi:ABC-type multidrug transport system ATPase subunit
MLFKIQIAGVRPIDSLVFERDLSKHELVCIVGKNGSGKTTLAKAVMNLAQADIFLKTSTSGVFDGTSTIQYTIDSTVYFFAYDPIIRSLSSKKPISTYHKSLVSVELPAPHGQRFTFFRTLADQDDDIRQSVVLGRYQTPTALIEFLSAIYKDARFADLKEVQFSRGVCCCFIKPDERYIREDYFSSGEYFLINLYRKVSRGTPLVFVDEIDVSLDASTQARLAAELRKLCKRHKSTVVFTSHSLALMQTLASDELYYLECEVTDGKTTLAPMSFNGVKSEMFGFEGYDRFILTEDDVLKQFLEYTISRYCSPTFYSYQIITAGGQGQAKGLMKRNTKYEFLGPSQGVICVLDGDQLEQNNVLCMPLQNVEQALWDEYRHPDFAHTFPKGENLHPKPLYREFTKPRPLLSSEEIFKLLCDRHEGDMTLFARKLSAFLCRPTS